MLVDVGGEDSGAGGLLLIDACSSCSNFALDFQLGAEASSDTGGMMVVSIGDVGRDLCEMAFIVLVASIYCGRVVSLFADGIFA